MKLFFTIILFFSFIRVVNAEEYLCSASLSKFGKPDEVEIKKYKRTGNKFQKISQYGTSNHSILNETSEILILSEIAPNSIFVTIINKNTREFVEQYITILKNLNGNALTGKCIVSY